MRDPGTANLARRQPANVNCAGQRVSRRHCAQTRPAVVSNSATLIAPVSSRFSKDRVSDVPTAAPPLRRQ